MRRVFSFGLGRFLERIVVTSAAARRKAPLQGSSAESALSAGERRILEHVAMASVEKRLKMPR